MSVDIFNSAINEFISLGFSELLANCIVGSFFAILVFLFIFIIFVCCDAIIYLFVKYIYRFIKKKKGKNQ